MTGMMTRDAVQTVKRVDACKPELLTAFAAEPMPIHNGFDCGIPLGGRHLLSVPGFMRPAHRQRNLLQEIHNVGFGCRLRLLR